MIPAKERNNARVKPALRGEDRRQAIAEIIRRWFPDPDCLKRPSVITRDEIDGALRRTG